MSNSPTVPPPMDWQTPTHHNISEDFTLTEAPGGYPDGLVTDNRVKEQVLETFVMLHLEEVCGFPLHFVSRGQGFSDTDLMAYDALNRVHIFELKKRTINEAAVSQLSQYLMQHLFQSVDDFIEDRWRRRREELDDNKRTLALYLAGTYANKRVNKIGRQYVVNHLPESLHDKTGYHSEWPISQNWWSKIDQAKRNGLLFPALLNDARQGLKYGNSMLDPGAIHKYADTWRARLGQKQRPPRPNWRSEKPVVLWLVAPNVTDGALEDVRQLRATGVDTRVVNVDLRAVPDKPEWYCKIRREDFPARDKLERTLIEEAEANTPSGTRIPKLDMQFYQEVSPSGRLGNSDGRPLDNPVAKKEKLLQTRWESVDI